MKKLIGILILLLLAGCSSTEKYPYTEEFDFDSVSKYEFTFYSYEDDMENEVRDVIIVESPEDIRKMNEFLGHTAIITHYEESCGCDYYNSVRIFLNDDVLFFGIEKNSDGTFDFDRFSASVIHFKDKSYDDLINLVESIGNNSSDTSVIITTQASITAESWQDAYAMLLRASEHIAFYLCDIDGNGTPELLVGGSPDDGKYSEYDVYTYKNNAAILIGDVATLSWSNFWLDGNNGILGYDYGAGGGGHYRYCINNDEICSDNDGYVMGYYFDGDGNQIYWFRGTDGSEIIVTEETEAEYQRIRNSWIELECCDITEANIAEVIYVGV